MVTSRLSINKITTKALEEGSAKEIDSKWSFSPSSNDLMSKFVPEYKVCKLHRQGE